MKDRDSWETPQDLWNKLDKQYCFTFDCCASDTNSKCDIWTDDFINYDDDFNIDLSWMNPPFSRAGEMFEHFFKTVKAGVAIYRCDNMETRVWQKQILKHADWILIFDKRINYEGQTGGGARFPSALIGLSVKPPENIKGKILIPEICQNN